VEICIKDSGPGIPLDQQGNLFHRFWQGDAGKDKKGGSGFGLYLASLIARGHGGTIECTSELHVGTKIVLRLPCVKTNAQKSGVYDGAQPKVRLSPRASR
jgi:signal transduction histidine kinase